MGPLWVGGPCTGNADGSPALGFMAPGGGCVPIIVMQVGKAPVLAQLDSNGVAYHPSEAVQMGVVVP